MFYKLEHRVLAKPGRTIVKMRSKAFINKPHRKPFRGAYLKKSPDIVDIWSWTLNTTLPNILLYSRFTTLSDCIISPNIIF